MEKEQRVSGTLRKEWLIKKQRVRSRCARRISFFVGVPLLLLRHASRGLSDIAHPRIDPTIFPLRDGAKTSHPKRTLILSVLSNGVEQI